MTGARSYTTKIWRLPSSIGFSSADALSTSMDPPEEPVISTRKRPCQKIQNGSEFPELMAQNFRNPQTTHDWCGVGGFPHRASQFAAKFVLILKRLCDFEFSEGHFFSDRVQQERSR